MSDYVDSNIFGGWDEPDARRAADQAEHDRSDAHQLELLDERDRDMPYTTASGLCPGCRCNAVLPESTLCADCLAEVVAA